MDKEDRLVTSKKNSGKRQGKQRRTSEKKRLDQGERRQEKVGDRGQRDRYLDLEGKASSGVVQTQGISGKAGQCTQGKVRPFPTTDRQVRQGEKGRDSKGKGARAGEGTGAQDAGRRVRLKFKVRSKQSKRPKAE